MNKISYLSAIFFFCLVFLHALVGSIIQINLGYEMITFHSFPGWLITTTAIYLIAGVFLLYYFHQKGYRLTFWSGAIMISANLVYAALIGTAKHLFSKYLC